MGQRQRQVQSQRQVQVQPPEDTKTSFPFWAIVCYLVATTGHSDWLAFQLKRVYAFFYNLLPFGKKKIAKPGSLAGTVGSAIALAVLLLSHWNVFSILIAIVASFMIGIIVVPIAAMYLYNRIGECEKHDGTKTSFDYNQINWDEVHGQFVAALSVYLFQEVVRPLPADGIYWFLFTSFVFFRIQDGWKDPFVRLVERRAPGALGVMLDDTMAGLEAFLINWFGLGVYYFFS